MRAKYIKLNRNKQQSPKTQTKKKHQKKKKQTNKKQNKNKKKTKKKQKKKKTLKTPNRQTLQTCRNIKKTQNNRL